MIRTTALADRAVRMLALRRHEGGPRLIAAALMLLPLGACGGTDGARSTLTTRDSAGIVIVENPWPVAAPALTVAGPFLEIGQVAGAEEYELHDVAGLARLSDGSVVVATGGTELRWFGADGKFVRRAGGDGDGPGEFRRIRYLRALAADTLLVFDSGTRRVSVVAPDGRYVRGEGIEGDGEAPVTVAGALRDGTLLTRAVLGTPPAATPMYRPRLEFEVAGEGASIPLPPYDGPEASLSVDGSGGGIGSVFISVLPLARAAHASAGPDHFFIGSSDSYQVDVWDANGRRVRIVRVAAPVTALTDEIRQTYVSGELERRRRLAEARAQPFEEASERRLLQEQPYPPALPAYNGLLANADGGMWVRDFRMPAAEPTPERWTIFDSEGRRVAVVELPPGFTPMYVEKSVVLGVHRDSLDVPSVHGYTVG